MKYYPRLAVGLIPTHVLLVYDLLATPEENRIAGADVTEWEDQERITNVGVRIFPTDNVTSATYDFLAKDNAERHLVWPRTYLWLDDDSTLTFVEKHRDRFWLVAVDLGKEGAGVEERRSLIDPEAVIRGVPGSPEYKRTLQEERERLAVLDLRAGPPGKIVVVLESRSVYRVTEFEMDLP